MRILRVLVLLTCTSAFAAVDPTLFQDLRWRLIGPFRGGRVLAVTGVPGEPEHFYFGSVNGGVWETKDAGRTWTADLRRAADRLDRRDRRGAVEPARDLRRHAARPTCAPTSRRATACTSRPTAARPGRTSASTDSQQIGRIAGRSRRIRTSSTSRRSAIPTARTPSAACSARRDGGSDVAEGASRNDDSDTGAIDLAFEPGNPKVIYAVAVADAAHAVERLSAVERPGQRPLQIDRRRRHWTRVTGHGFPAKPGRIGLAVAPSAAAARLRDRRRGRATAACIARDDGGANWTHSQRRRAHLGARLVLRRDHRRAEESPTSSTRLQHQRLSLRRTAARPSCRSRARRAATTITSSGSIRDNRERRILGVDQGAVDLAQRRRDLELLVQPADRPVLPRDHRQPFPVLGLRRAAGLRRGRRAQPHQHHRRHHDDGVPRDDRGRRERQHRARSEGPGHRLRRPRATGSTCARSRRSRSIRRSRYPGNDRAHVDAAAGLLAARSARALLREPAPVPHRGRRRALDGDQPRPDARGSRRAAEPRSDHGGEPAADRAAARRDLRDRAVAHRRSRPLGRHRRRPDLAHARRRRALGRTSRRAALTAWSKVGIIDASHFDAETAYAAVDRHRLDDFKPYIYRTHDGGKTWQLVADGIPTDSFVNAVREDPVRQGLLYAGTEKRRLRLVRRRRPLAAAAAEPAGDLGARHRRARRRRRDRHARPRLLGPRRRDAAAAGRASAGASAWLFAPADRGPRAAGRIHRHADAEGRADGGRIRRPARTSTTCSQRRRRSR